MSSGFHLSTSNPTTVTALCIYATWNFFEVVGVYTATNAAAMVYLQWRYRIASMLQIERYNVRSARLTIESNLPVTIFARVVPKPTITFWSMAGRFVNALPEVAGSVTMRQAPFLS